MFCLAYLDLYWLIFMGDVVCTIMYYLEQNLNLDINLLDLQLYASVAVFS